MTEAETNVRALDAAYKPFPTFEEWASRTSVDPTRWDRYYALLKSRGQASPAALARAREVAKRAAALDTGAIEGLYDVDRGFTFTVAFETAAWETALAQRGEAVRPLFEAQLKAYDYVLDLATSAQPFAEAAIRKLHEVVCEAQTTYRVMTAAGPQEQPLPKGVYKVLPNHVRTRKGTDHAYAPVDVTPAEMARLMEQLRTEAFQSAHPVQQAAYAHYSFVAIHPFSDGNGRVARALASVFTYRAISMPILILSEQKSAYLDSLETADGGDFQAFVDFLLARCLDTIQLVNDSLGFVSVPALNESLEGIKALYVTRGGFTHEQIDEAGRRLLAVALESFKKALPKAEVATKVSSSAQLIETFAGGSAAKTPGPAYRTLGRHRSLHFSISSSPPAQASTSMAYNVWVPRDAAGSDDLIMQDAATGATFTSRIEEVISNVSGVLQIRLDLFAEQVIAASLAKLKDQAAAALRSRS